MRHFGKELVLMLAMAGISIFRSWVGDSIAQPAILDLPKRSLFSASLLLPLPSAKLHLPENHESRETAPFQ
jgi:hypothetical protein